MTAADEAAILALASRRGITAGDWVPRPGLTPEEIEDIRTTWGAASFLDYFRSTGQIVLAGKELAMWTKKRRSEFLHRLWTTVVCRQ